MLKQTFEFKDFNGNTRKVDLYFHMSDIEVVDFSKRDATGLRGDMEDMVAAKNIQGILDFIRDLVHWSYGIKDEDGIHFDKSPEITRRFVQTAYYSDFIFSLFENDGAKGLEFVNNVLPPALIESAQRMIDEQKAKEAAAEASKEYAPSAREIFDATERQAPQSRSEARQQGYTE